MTAPNVDAPAETGHRVAPWSSALTGVLIAIALAALLDLLGLAIVDIIADPFELTRGRVNTLMLGGGVWLLFANVVALEIGFWVATRARRVSSPHRGAALGLAVWGLAFLVAGFGGHRAAAETLAAASEATAQALQGDEEISRQDLGRAANAAREVADELAWWGGAGLALGAVGACLGPARLTLGRVKEVPVLEQAPTG
jgi:hypothetical protein